MRRYAAWHKTDPGYDTAEEVQRYIDRQGNSGDWRIVATDDDFQIKVEAEQVRINNVQRIIDSAVNDAIKREHRRIATKLGLDGLNL